MRVGAIKVIVSNCITGIYLRWWFNGWHYFNFTNGYEIVMNTEAMDTQVTKMFSVISKIERPTRLKTEYSYQIILEGITAPNIGGFTGLLMAEKVEMYEGSLNMVTADTTLITADSDLTVDSFGGGLWREVELTRGSHKIRDAGAPGYILSFEITRKELVNSASVYLKSLRLYLGDVLCDMDEDEVIPINRQTNDIAEMQDRQSDFTAQFRIRKTRAMKALFQLSGEVGISTVFPYQIQTCKLISDNIEIITGGNLTLEKVNDQYYDVSILSGNKNFFKAIENLRITDLTLASADHTWDVATMAGSHAADLDYVYPLCEPSDDAGISPLTDDGDRVEMYGGWIWPFIKVKAIWDEIFTNAGFICEGDILTNEFFTRMFMPVSSRSITKAYTDQYLYSAYWQGYRNAVDNDILGAVHFPGALLIRGTGNFLNGFYYLPYDGTYKIAVKIIKDIFSPAVTLTVDLAGILNGTMTPVSSVFFEYNYEYEVTGTVGQAVVIKTTAALYYYYAVRITEITNAMISYSSAIVAHNHLPGLSQTDFVKMICNLFGLIPEVTPRDRKIKFWNYSELYNNIARARDWSAYLSERDDDTGFKYGDYAKDNYLRYKDSDDVIKDNGRGSMQIDDETLPEEKDVVEVPVSTCDEVSILANVFGVNVSRIAFNNFNPDTSVYDSNKTIDPRIVYVDHVKQVASPPYEKTFGIRATVAPGAATDIDSPKKASSLEVSFSTLIYNYSALSRLLTKTSLRRAKFNLPVYEVAGFKSYIPVYLSQYKAYFYVNKINNYVPGKLCIIDLIKL
jgi:hypothetical protein